MKLASGAPLAIFDTLDSTSLEAKRQAASGAPPPIWILALKQTSGYGRRGAGWVHREGDVAASLLFRPAIPPERFPELSFVAGLAACRTIAAFAPAAALSLKWPNDVLAGGAKIAGLLLELIPADDRTEAVCLGLGVNIVSAPGGLPYKTARLIDLTDAPAPPPVEFIKAFDQSFDHLRRVWERDGFAPIRTAWLELGTKKGRQVVVRLANETVEGAFCDLDYDGALILDCDGARRRITAGTVVES